MNPLISICMIDKNEERVIERCLQSVHKYAEEIIIVDTGSTDSTLSIAKRFTNNLYHFEWINDFSAARNEALRHATGKWIVSLDADEYFDESEMRKLVACLSEMTPDPGLIYNLTVVSILGDKSNYSTNEAPVGRVFGNRLDIKYTRPIHEQPVSTRGIEMKSVLLPVRLHHSGYAEEAIRAKDKHNRNLKLFKKLESESGLSAYDYLQLGNQYAMMHEYDKALEHLNKAMQDPKGLGTAYKQTLFTAIQTLINKGDLAKAYSFYETHLTPYEEYPDIQAIKGIILQNLGLMEEAKAVFHQAVNEAERRAALQLQASIVSPDAAMRLPLYQLAALYEKELNYAQSVYFYTKLVMTNAKEIQALGKFIELLSLREKPSDIIVLINKLLQPDRLTNALLAKICIVLGNAELAAYYANRDETEQLLKHHEKLRYYLLTNRMQDFLNAWASADSSARSAMQSLKIFIIGGLVWNQSEWFKEIRLPDDHACQELIEWSQSFLLGTELPAISHASKIELLRTLFEINRYDLFDHVIESIADAKVINDMANYFYEHHHVSEAVQYYDILIQRNELDADSCSNLAFYHAVQGKVAVAQQFLELAIGISPKRKDLLVRYILLCSEPVAREKAKRHLFELDAGYADLRLL